MPSNKKNEKETSQDLMMERKSCFEKWNPSTIKKCFGFAEDYKSFLNNAKTAKEAVSEGIKLAKANSFKDLKNAKGLKAGDKVYLAHRDKSIIFARIGNKKLDEGIKLIMSHVDSPRLDFKLAPLYEEEGVAFFKTHYYGGIKKYQWPTIPLTLHGTVYLENGKEVEINIGEKQNEPVFMITDLLPHLDREGGPGSEVKPREVQGEDLNMIVGSIPEKQTPRGKEKAKERIKLAILKLLNEKYGIKEEDLTSADLSAVPSEKTKDLGFDKSMISGYGHDDKACAYTSLKALIETKNTEKTQICAWVDREEIGSEGNTGAQSIFFENFLSEILEKTSKAASSISKVYKVFSKSKAISADTSPALDPDYKDVYDPRNAHRLGYGMAFEKYTGAGGKGSTSEASGEFLRDIRRAFNKNKEMNYQISGGIGKIDQGGGGTIAKFMANRDVEIVDAGIPLFNMHAPLEVASKADIYSAYLGYKIFLTDVR